MKITRVEVKNYKGIKHAEFAVGSGGAIIKGRCKSGKTSLRDAVLAALQARHIGPEHIHQGADRAEILVDTDAAIRVRRTSSPAGQGLTVTNADGDKWSRPQTRLDDLFGPSLDPAAFYLSDKKERQKMLLAAMPATVTAEDVERWTRGQYQGDVDGHGLEVIGRVRKLFYDRRTEANRTAKASADAAKAKQQAAEALAGKVPAAAPAVPAAQKALADAMAAIAALEQRKAQAAEQEVRAAGTRERIEKLRVEAEARRAAIVGPVDAEDRQYQESEVEQATAEVERLAAELDAAKRRLETARVALRRVYEVDEKAKKDQQDVEATLGQARDLESTLAETSIAPPTAEEIAGAADAACRARDALADAEAVEASAQAKADAEEAHVRATVDAEAAGELDAIVETLTTAAPRELASRAKLIPGLAFTDVGITLDGKVLDALSGAEQLEFSVELAKRLSPNGRLLCVDKLEAFDPDALEDFVRLCCAGDWQLLGTRVERGELVIEAIEADQPADAQPVGEKSKRLTVVMPE